MNGAAAGSMTLPRRIEPSVVLDTKKSPVVGW